MLLPLGVVAGFAVYRFANLVTGAFWIIREGDIRVERLWGNGEMRADHIEGQNVKAITIERRGRSEDEHCIVAIRLQSGGRFRSPRIGSRNEARAVGTEIVRRLGIGAEANQSQAKLPPAGLASQPLRREGSCTYLRASNLCFSRHPLFMALSATSKNQSILVTYQRAAP